MKKYSVVITIFAPDGAQAIIRDEIFTIDQIKDLGKKYIGDIFEDEYDLDKTIKNIENKGKDKWRVYPYIISIKEKKWK